MDDDEFKNFVVDKLISIENRISTLEEARRQESTLVRLITVVVSILLAKLGIDVSGILR